MYIGTVLLCIAALHVVVAFVMYWPELSAVIAEGVLATVPDHGERAAAFWVLYTGVVFAVLGWVVREGERERSYLPRALVPALALLGLAVVIPMPASGGWLFFGVAALAWRRAQKKRG